MSASTTGPSEPENPDLSTPKPAVSPHASQSPAAPEGPAESEIPHEPAAVARRNRSTGLALAGTAVVGFLAGLAGAAIVAIASTLIGPGAELSDRLTAVETSVGTAASRRVVEGLDKRAAALEQRADALQGSLDGLGKRVETTQASLAQAGDQARTALEQARSVAEKAAAAPAASSQDAPPDIGALTEQLEASKRQVSAMEQRLAAVDQRLNELSGAPKGPTSDEFAKTIAGLRDKIGEAAKPAPGTAEIGIALLARDKLRAGAPLGHEIAALKALGVDEAALAPLRPFADTPAPSMAALTETFASSARAIIAAQKPAGSGNLLDRLSLEAASLVRVRKIGDPKGNEPADIVSRIETALAQDRLADAMAAWNTLPDASRAASEAFAEQANARLAARQALDGLVAASLDKMVAGATGAGVPSR